MFILTEKDTGGVYALPNKENVKTVHMFQQKEDAQRYMAWFALWGMLLYPSLVVFSILISLDQAAKILGDMAGVYFIAVAGIVAAFFGAQAMTSNKNN